MRNRNNSSGVVEDIWINTQAGVATADPADRETTTDWKELEQENNMLNPDPSILDRG